MFLISRPYFAPLSDVLAVAMDWLFNLVGALIWDVKAV